MSQLQGESIHSSFSSIDCDVSLLLPKLICRNYKYVVELSKEVVPNLYRAREQDPRDAGSSQKVLHSRKKRQSETLVTNKFGQNTEYKSFRTTIMFYCIKNFNQNVISEKE